MFKRLLAIFLAALLCLSAGAALAETTFEGTVVAGSTLSVNAPFGGAIDAFSLRAGDVIQKGDLVAALETTKVYAPSDGTVTAVFMKPGDSLEDVAALYGAPLYLTPVNRYTISADIEYAYNQMENKYVNTGETVYISCAAGDGKHTGEGVVTSVDGNTFIVKTTSGELMVDEDVRIYRQSDYSAKSRIGGGAVARVSDVAVSGTGSLLKIYVAQGDTVQRGQLLYETVAGDLDGLYASSNQVLSTLDGIIAAVNVQAGSTVSKGDSLLTIYPQDTLLIEVSASEYDLSVLHEGDPVTFTLNYQEAENRSYEGAIDLISYLGEEIEGEMKYNVYISFPVNADVRLGMTAAVTTK